MSNLTPEQKAYLQYLKPSYTPSVATLEHLGSVTLATISGPRCSGKDTIKDISGLPTVQGIVTRDPRPSEKPNAYRFRPDTVEEYARIITELRRGEWVQYNVGMNDYIYGSDLSDYTAPVTLMDNTPQSSLAMRALPFKNFVHTYISVPYDQWWRRFSEIRLPELSEEQAQATMQEALDSIAFALDNADQFVFVDNSNGRLEQAAETVIRASFGEVDRASSAAAQDVTHDFLVQLRAA